MSIKDPDQINETKNLYNISTGEIIWRNFLAGMSRTLGGLVIYFLLAFLLGQVFLALIWPVIAPTVQTLGNTNSLLLQLNALQGSQGNN
jgi:hypothetical protein